MNKPDICCIGLGAIGLPSACFIAAAGYKVYGIDSNHELIQQLQQAKLQSNEPKLAELFHKVAKDNLICSSKPIAADIYLVIVPTILNEDRSANTEQLFSAIDGMLPLLKAGDLVIVESTCPVGIANKIKEVIATKVQGVLFAYCPERIMPGNIIYELEYNTRLVGTDDPKSQELAIRFYQSIVKGQLVPCSIREAEAAKLLENIYRDINIAFANEISMAAEKYELDAHRLIELANLHPRVNILEPGVGVGGYCIQDNPWFLVSAFPDAWSIPIAARKVNTAKNLWVINKIISYLEEHKLSRIACFGATYKANVADVRKSPALEIINKLKESYQVRIVDPYLTNSASPEEAAAWAEIIIGLVPHKVFKEFSLQNYGAKHQLDFAKVFL